ncbi:MULTISPECIES: Stk1 family PASTA domain-containing Ser/Thr kinase [Helcococcus]|uniref:Stk1 family PASTA domain-containing Ser/Thr kinase n=1 Tax=Helcococcus bovis TaxID=3153252 RepID=A0ABW9F5P2_9FIRM
MKGKVLNNRYEIRDIIGMGGMAIVYDGYDTVLNREVAIKILKDNLVENEEFFNRLKEEASASASISDDNIVSIYDISTTIINDKSVDYIVMEKIKGTTLKEIIHEKSPLSNEMLLDYSMQIAKALQSAHIHGLVHRDIKPANILVNGNNKIKVTDFGIARVASDVTITYTSSILGTVHYISPEQAKGQPIDSRSDLYSLGVLMYEMATGKVPFDGESPVGIAVKHIQEYPQPISEINPNFDKNLEKVILKLLNKNPEDRYKTASNVLIDLNKIKTGRDIDIKGREKDRDKTVKIARKEDVLRESAVYKAKVAKSDDSESNIGEKNKPNWKLIIIIGILVLAIFGTIYAIANNLSIKNEDSLFVTVPSVIDVSEKDAINLLKETGIEVSIKERIFDKSIIKGNVILQSIKPQTKIKKGDVIELTISKGRELVRVPNIVGFNVEDVKDIIKKNGFKIGTTSNEDSDAPKGQIVKQFPKEGEKIESGSEINIILSNGTKKDKKDSKIIVPSVLNYEQEEAISLLKKSNLDVKIESEASNVVRNLVIKQKPEPSTQVESGSIVTIVISTGPQTNPENNPKLQEYVFNVNVPNTPKKTFNLTIINNTTGEVVFNNTLNKDNAKDGKIQVKFNAIENAKFDVYFDGEKADVNYGN